MTNNSTQETIDTRTKWYQMKAGEFAADGTDLVTIALGLTGEAGEFADHIKKWRNHGHELDRDHLIKELGDQIWYVANGCRLLGVSMDDVMVQNIRKLEQRYKTGKLTPEESQNRAEYKNSEPDPGPDVDKYTYHSSGVSGQFYVEDQYGQQVSFLKPAPNQDWLTDWIEYMHHKYPDEYPTTDDASYWEADCDVWVTARKAPNGLWMECRAPVGQPDLTKDAAKRILDGLFAWITASTPWPTGTGSAESAHTVDDSVYFDEGGDGHFYFGGEASHVGIPIGSEGQDDFCSAFDAYDEELEVTRLSMLRNFPQPRLIRRVLNRLRRVWD